MCYQLQSRRFYSPLHFVVSIKMIYELLTIQGIIMKLWSNTLKKQETKFFDFHEELKVCKEGLYIGAVANIETRSKLIANIIQKTCSAQNGSSPDKKLKRLKYPFIFSQKHARTHP